MMRCLVWSALVAAALRADTLHKDKVNPVEKVTALLAKLQKEVEAEGKEEAAAYDKYACFCKEQADNKNYAIEKFKEREDLLTGKIEDKNAKKAGVDQSKLEHDNEIRALEAKQAAQQTIRENEHAAYAAREAELSEAITGTSGAIEKVRASTKDMANAKTSMLLIKEYAPLFRTTLSLANILGVSSEGVAALVQASNDPHGYSFQGGKILNTLNDLLKEFKTEKVALDKEEQKSRQAHEMIAGARTNKINALKKTSSEEGEASASLAEQLSEHQTELQETEAARTADEAFLKELVGKCEHKAKTFDQRSGMRSDELKALADAMNLLKGDVTKMNTISLAQKAPTPARKGGHWQWVEDAKVADAKVEAPKLAAEAPKVEKVARKVAASKQDVESDESDDSDDEEMEEPVDFLQVRASPSKEARKQLISMLAAKAEQIKSPELSTLLIKLQDTSSPFKKVKEMIKALVARLEKEAADEANQKAWCDTETTNAKADEADAQLQIEGLNSKLTEKNAKSAQLKEDIATLAQEVADLQKGLNEETEVRTEEKSTHEHAIADADAGRIAVSGALDFLNDFYGNALLQAPAAEGYERFVADGAGSDGQTVDDMAPEAADTTYHGSQGASKSIIGLLEVIKTDFEDTITKTQNEEADAVGEYETFKSTSESSIDAKTTLSDEKSNTRTQTKSDITDAETNLRSQKVALTLAKEELLKLKPVCVDTGASWAERAARRKQEIEALKEAKALFEGTVMPHP